VYVRPLGGWGSTTDLFQTAKLTVANPVYDASQIGHAVTISGDGATVIVGSPWHYYNPTTGFAAGAVFLYYKPVNGWTNATESAEIYGSIGGGYRGSSLSLSSDASTLVVGAIRRNTYTGVAEINVRRVNPGFPDYYSAEGALLASDGQPYDYFGYSADMNADGSVVVVGAPTTAWFDRGAGKGSAYVFVRPVNGWGPWSSTYNEIAKLTASDGQNNDSFGISVAISANGNTAVAGASQLPLYTGPINGPGKYYVFARPASGWATMTETSKVNAPDSLSGNFGNSTSINTSGTEIVAGAPWAKIGTKDRQGAAFIYTGSPFAPVASVAPLGLTFAPQTVGTTSAAQTVTLTNTGLAPLTVTNVGATGPFSVTQNCVSGSPIAPGGSCTSNVAFAPVAAGSASGTLTFTDDSGGTAGATQNVQLSGVGTKANTTTTIASISPNPALLNQPVSISFAVAPQGGGMLAPSGTVTVQASTGESCTGAAPSGSCSITFATTADRTITASYSGDAGFNGSASAASSLKIGDFSVSAAPSSVTVAGRKGSYKVTVAGVNGFIGNVALACSGGPANATCTMSPVSLALSGPSAEAKATVTVPNGSAAGSYTITFTATVGSALRSTTATLVVR
jgi:Bacterial Ig-like domain (group 3)/FG-GAP repeat/Abnormal spindle-like microcephaly-assoc'd, ASPM-SPD-2-Hydin